MFRIKSRVTSCAIQLRSYRSNVAPLMAPAIGQAPQDSARRLYEHYRDRRSSPKDLPLSILYSLQRLGGSRLMEGLEFIMKNVKESRSEWRQAVQLMEEFESFTPSSTLFSTFTSILVKCEDEEVAFLNLKKFYSKYRELYLLNTSDLYVQICKAFCRHGDSGAVEVLADMLRGNYEPTAQMSEELLEYALLYKEPKVVRGIVSWYLTTPSLSTAMLSRGLIVQILRFSCDLGDENLASNAVELLTRSGYAFTGDVFYGLIKSFAKAGNLPSAVEAVIDMHQKGIVFSPNDKHNHEANSDIRRLMAALFLRQDTNLLNAKDTKDEREQIHQEKVAILENVYFALSEQAKQGVSLPPVLIEAVIQAMSCLGQFEQSFSTLKEVDKVFNLSVSVNFYNALLEGVVSSEGTNILEKVITVFQDLEDFSRRHPDDFNSTPNDETYSIIFDALLAHGKFSAVIELWKQCQTSKIYPKVSTLRKMTITLMRHKYILEAEEMAESVRQRTLNDEYRLFTQRISFLKNQVQTAGKVAQKVR